MIIRLISPFHRKAMAWEKGQSEVWEGLEKNLRFNQKPVAWFHTASMGEFEQGRPIIDAFKQAYPDYFILVTFFSPSGYEVRKSAPGIDFVSYLPFDSAQSATRFLDLVKPKLAIFVKYEFWYFYLTGLQKREIPSLLVSAIFRPNQVFFAWYGQFFKKIVASFTYIFVQDIDSKNLLERIDMSNVTIGGDTRFDRVLSNARQGQRWDLLTDFLQETAFIVVGSAWQADMDCLLPLINSKRFPVKWVIVPHEIHDSKLRAWEASLQLAVMYSKGEKVTDAEVLIVNEVGRLSSLYRGASFAYIGGAFGAGLHNTLEAAVFGPTVFFGNKNYMKFKEAVDLVACGLAFPVGSTQELEEKMSEIWEDEQLFVNKQVQSRQFVALHAGATHRIMDYINQNLNLHGNQ
jgi:3-deoxy-D-manno-octulosonic-acid transferase